MKLHAFVFAATMAAVSLGAQAAPAKEETSAITTTLTGADISARGFVTGPPAWTLQTEQAAATNIFIGSAGVVREVVFTQVKLDLSTTGVETYSAANTHVVDGVVFAKSLTVAIDGRDAKMEISTSTSTPTAKIIFAFRADKPASWTKTYTATAKKAEATKSTAFGAQAPPVVAIAKLFGDGSDPEVVESVFALEA
jgi:hypothetical protein